MTIYLTGILNYTEVENVYGKQILLKYRKNLKVKRKILDLSIGLPLSVGLIR